MTEQQLDSQGEARDALRSIVADFGPRVLSDPRMLGSRMSDLLPDLPKERQLLITAAEADVAGDLTRHVQDEHLDPNTAVQLVAGSLTDRKSIDPASSMWVAAEYAQAMGYRVQPGAMPPPSRPFSPPQPPGQPTVTTYGGQQGPTIGAPQGYGGYGQPQPPTGGGGYGQPQPPTGGGGYGQPQPPTGGGGYGQPQPPSGGGGYYPQQPGGGQAPPQQGTPGWVQPPPRSGRNRGRLYGIGAAAAAVVVILAVGFGTNWFSGTKHTPTPPPTHPPTHPVTSPVTTPPAQALDPLVQLLPGDVDDPASQCQSYASPDWDTTGAIKSYQCVDPGLPGNNNDVFGFQFDTYAHYLASWQAFNNAIGFTTITKGANCPPPAGDAAGTTEWKDDYFPYRDGQVLECGTVGSGSSAFPEYIWSYPSENAYVWAHGGPGMTLKAMDTWWLNFPVTSPSPSP